MDTEVTQLPSFTQCNPATFWANLHYKSNQRVKRAEEKHSSSKKPIENRRQGQEEEEEEEETAPGTRSTIHEGTPEAQNLLPALPLSCIQQPPSPITRVVCSQSHNRVLSTLPQGLSARGWTPSGPKSAPSGHLVDFELILNVPLGQSGRFGGGNNAPIPNAAVWQRRGEG